MGYGYSEYVIGDKRHYVTASGTDVIHSLDLMCDLPDLKAPCDKKMKDIAARAGKWIMEGTIFSHPFEQCMTPYQKKAYELLMMVPKGKVTTYGAIARAIKSSSARAVGRTMGMNKIPLLVPCHRVIRSDGNIGGYAYGQELKEWILEKEGIDGARSKKIHARYIINDLLDFDIL